MSKVYIVEANFDEYDASWSTTIGIYTDKSVAESAKEKWDKFYIENRNLFDGLDGNSDDDDEVNKYYTMKAIYGEILEFQNITITEFVINTETFLDNSTMRTEKMQEILKQWGRDYKINEVLKNNNLT